MKELEALRRRGWLSAIDTELARCLCRLVDESDPLLYLAIALASRQVRQGHVCADLGALERRPLLDPDGEPIDGVAWPPFEQWLAALGRSKLVGDESADRPLVLDGRGRLYLARYFRHERKLAELLRQRARQATDLVSDGSMAAELLRQLGPRTPQNDGQRAAAMIACLGHLTIICGGPGTGKTTAVVKLLSLLETQGKKRVLLLAPTGKAAARLGEATSAAGSARAASTIHRALGPFGFRPGFRHDRARPLDADVVVVDESSMVDIALMRRLCEAVPDAARLILLGDPDQLASVEAGAVLGDIASRGAGRSWSQALHDRARVLFAEPLPGSVTVPGSALADSVAELTHSHRFSTQGGIGAVAGAIRRGDAARAIELLSRPESEARLVDPSPEAFSREIGRALVDGYAEALRVTSASQALAGLGRFRVLCAHRRGARGVEAINDLAERALADAGLIAPRLSSFYPGRPLIITHNDPALGLFNGDVGVLWRDADGSVRAYFAEPGGGLRHLSPARLPPHETVFATSIHKSQGSELDRVLVVLPREGSPLLSRELVYTAITRARQQCIVVGSVRSLEIAISRRAERASGLADRLWG